MEYVAKMDEVINAYKTLVGKPERKRLFGRPWLRRYNNIKTNLRDRG